MKRSLLVFGLLALTLSACDGDKPGNPNAGPKQVSAAEMYAPAPGGTANPDGGAPVALTITGKITFDRLTATASGLSATPINLPARGISVAAIDHKTLNTVLATTSTDANGDFTLSFSTSVDFYVRASAQAGATPIDFSGRVITSQAASGNLVYSVQSPILNRSAGSQTVNVNANIALPLMRGGAFSIFDTVQRLYATGAPSGPALELMWGAGNLGTSFLTTMGGAPIQTNTSYLAEAPSGGPGLMIAGGRWDNVANSDHDEFDDAVIAHEFVHALMRQNSRVTNWGGPHSGEALFHGAAYEEGMATGLACILRGSKDYFDTVGLPSVATMTQFAFDCENPTFAAGVPSVTSGVTGYQSEFAVAAVVWDLIDGATGAPVSTDGDPVAITLATFRTSFDALQTRNGTFNFAYLATLLQQLIDDAALSSGNANTLVSPYNAAFPPTGGDIWPPNVSTPGMASGSLDASTGPGGTIANQEIGTNSNDEYRLALAIPQTCTFSLTVTTGGYDAALHRVDLYVYDLAGQLVAFVTNNSATKMANVNLVAGEYLIRVHHAAANAQPVAYTLTLS